jgi:hypothetical protein
MSSACLATKIFHHNCSEIKGTETDKENEIIISKSGFRFPEIHMH